VTNNIRIKRRASGGSAGAPASLANAELAYNESDAGNGILYYGYGTGGAGGSATQIVAIGGDGAFVNLTGTQVISGNKSFTGTLTMSGATIDAINTTGSIVVGGNLTVNGTTTTVNSTTITVDDKNIELGSVNSPTDAGADTGGIILKGATDKTILWLDSTDAWTFSEHVALASGKSYYINGSTVLSATALGSGVVQSSLTSVGTLTSGSLGAGFTTVAIARGGTGASDASTARTNLGIAIGTNVQAWDTDLDTLSGMQAGAATALAALTSTEVAIIDGSTSATATTLALSDRMVINDGGAMVQVALSDLVTFLENGAVSGFDIDGGTY